MKVIPRWYVKSNQSEYFYNDKKKGIRVCRSGVDASGNLFDPPFLWKAKNISPIVGTLSTMLAKKSGLGLLNIVTSVNKKYRSLKCSRTYLIQDVTGEGVFSNDDQLLALREERLEERKMGMTSMSPNSRK